MTGVQHPSGTQTMSLVSKKPSPHPHFPVIGDEEATPHHARLAPFLQDPPPLLRALDDIANGPTAGVYARLQVFVHADRGQALVDRRRKCMVTHICPVAGSPWIISPIFPDGSSLVQRDRATERIVMFSPLAVGGASPTGARKPSQHLGSPMKKRHERIIQTAVSPHCDPTNCDNPEMDYKNLEFRSLCAIGVTEDSRCVTRSCKLIRTTQTSHLWIVRPIWYPCRKSCRAGM
ncbi:hypothetical protein PG997_011903 [Apiospora hydei]|uniref:Uncharacterized protein n=1 Tax=Apiospora hydei TaxID=1337664 RepID=A0ABR1V1S3_9PEZI